MSADDRLTDEQLREWQALRVPGSRRAAAIVIELLVLRARVAQLEAAMRGLIKCLEGEFDGAKLAEATNKAFAALAQPAESGDEAGVG